MSSKLLLCLLAAMLFTGIGCNRDPESVKKAYVEKGNDYFKNGKYKEASIFYRSALKKDMRYGEAYYRLGLAEMKLGRPAEALRSFRRAYELQPDNLDAASQLADLYLTAYISDPRRPKEVETFLKDLQEALLKKDAKSFLGLRIKGYLAIGAKDVVAALEAFQKAHEVKPYSKEIVLPLMESLAANNRMAEAEKLGFEMIAKDKTNGPIYDWLYIRFLSQKRVEDAEKIYIQKVDNNPKQTVYILQLATFYFVTQRKPDMEKTLARITGNSKDFPVGHVAVGDFYRRINDIDNAVKHYEAGLAMASNSKDQKAMYQKRLVDTLIARGRKKEALDLVSVVLKDNPTDNQAIALRASLWLQDGSKEKVASAISELNSVIVRQPENFVLRFDLGRAYLAKGDVDQARVQFQEAIKYRPDYSPARLALAQLHLAKNEFTKAMQMADDILRYDPNNVTARMVKTSSRMGLGDLPTARQELTQVLSVSPNMPDALFQLGVLNFQEKKFKDAEELFVRLQKVAPNDPRGLIGRVEAFVSTNRHEEAINLLQTDLTQNPERSFYRLALGNVAVRAKKFPLAIQEYNKLMEKNPKNFDVQIRLAEAHRLNGEIPVAINAFQKARELNPNDATAYVRLALLYEGQGRRTDARPLYEQILKINPDNPIALNNLAFALAETGGDLDQALTMAQRAKAKFPDDPNISDTLGWVYIKKNLSDQAVKIFREVVEKNGDNPIFRYHLAMALFQKGDKPSAKKECEIALKSKPSREDEQRIRELMSRI